MKRLITLVSLSLAVILSSCVEERSGRLIVRLVDSPGDYESVFVDIQDIRILRDGMDAENGWKSLQGNTGVYDLLELTGGSEIILVDKEIPSGNISQIELVLGTDNSIVVSGSEFSLDNQALNQDGLKVTIEETILEGFVYSVVLDFDAGQSIVENGNEFQLEPVVRSIKRSRTGSIKGKLYPVEENVLVKAESQTGQIYTSYARADSPDWIVGGLEPGLYTLTFDPGDNSMYQPAVLTDLVVSKAEILQLSEMELSLK